ncbi:MAG: hypothetical protein M1823_003027 [Watsoniomyces obsoletus]|nr:MAG: hypothetical protein M1823_003027 [Watsoniomyces obsoletus]
MKMFISLLFPFLLHNTLAGPLTPPGASPSSDQAQHGMSSPATDFHGSPSIRRAPIVADSAALGPNLIKGRHRKRSTGSGDQVPPQNPLDPYAEEEVFKLNNPPGQESEIRRRMVQFMTECFIEYGVGPQVASGQMALPPGVDVVSAIQQQLREWGKYRKMNLDRERQAGQTPPVTEGGSSSDQVPPSSSNPGQNPDQPSRVKKVAGHQFGVPSLKVDREQARQLFQHAKERVQRFEISLPKAAALQPQFFKGVPSMQQMPKLAKFV